MKTLKGSESRQRTEAERRGQLLRAFECSGLSAAAFARQEGLNYTTFCGWRQRQTKAQSSPAFVQIEVTPTSAPVELVVELGASGRMRITSIGQMELAARLLRSLNAPASC